MKVVTTATVLLDVSSVVMTEVTGVTEFIRCEIEEIKYQRVASLSSFAADFSASLRCSPVRH